MATSSAWSRSRSRLSSVTSAVSCKNVVMGFVLALMIALFAPPTRAHAAAVRNQKQVVGPSGL
jgi:hypothetical protein